MFDSGTKSASQDIESLSIAPAEGWNNMFIDGEWIHAEDKQTTPIIDPTTGDTIGKVPVASAGDVDRAYKIAEEAQPEWAALPPQERVAVVEEARRLIDEYTDDLITLFGIELGATQLKSNIEMDLVRNMMKVSEGMGFESNGGHKQSTIPGKENIIQREPVGVVGVISPWNFPFHLSMRAVAPALALGNSVVLKPSSSSSLLGGLVIARLFEEAGLPSGLLNVVTGTGSETGAYVSDHSVPSVISFTGSTAIGRQVAENAARNLALPSLELGGNNVHIVTEDADLDRAVDGGTFGSFTHQGQECISINRHLVHEDVYDEYVERLAARADELRVGDPLNNDIDVGPIINESQHTEIVELVESSIKEGAIVEAGGDYEGLFIEPTVLSEVTNDMPIAANEHFGPIAPVIPFSDDQEAIAMANDTEYGLSGSVHSTDIGRAREIADAIDTGMIHINDQTLNDEAHVPFGGVGASGIGRYNADAIMHELTQTKWISIQREPREYPL